MKSLLVWYFFLAGKVPMISPNYKKLRVLMLIDIESQPYPFKMAYITWY